MSQQRILDVLEKKGRLFATEIINELRHDDEAKEFIRRVLKQMRKYNDINYIGIKINNVTENNKKVFEILYPNGKKKVLKENYVYKKYPEINGKIITRRCFLYFLK